MPRSPKRRLVPIVGCAAAATVVPALLLALALLRHAGGDVSGAYVVNRWLYERSVLSERYPEGTLLLQPGGYDSALFLELANDPLLRRTRALRPDDAALFYRGQRILYPWLGWLLGGGQPRAILYALPAVSCLALGLGTAVVATTLARHGRRTRASLLFAASIGAAVCVLRPLSDALATSLLVAGCAAWCRRRFGWSALAFAAATLTREASILVPAALGATHLVGRSGAEPPDRAPARGAVGARLREALPLVAVPAVAIAWWAYVLHLVGGRFAEGPTKNLAAPFAGLATKLTALAADPMGSETLLFGLTTASLVPVVLCPPRRWDGVRVGAAALLVLALFLSEPVWREGWAYGRVPMAIPALALFLWARDGRRLDLVAPVLAAAAGAVVWAWALVG